MFDYYLLQLRHFVHFLCEIGNIGEMEKNKTK